MKKSKQETVVTIRMSHKQRAVLKQMTHEARTSMNQFVLERVFADNVVELADEEDLPEVPGKVLKMITVRMSKAHKATLVELSQDAEMSMNKYMLGKILSNQPVASLRSLEWDKGDHTIVTLNLTPEQKEKVDRLSHAAHLSMNKFCVLRILVGTAMNANELLKPEIRPKPAPRPPQAAIPLHIAGETPPIPKINGKEIDPDIVDLIRPRLPQPVNPNNIFAKEWFRLQPYHVKLESHPTVHILNPGTNYTICGVTPHARGGVERKWRQCNDMEVTCSTCKWREHKSEQEWT